MTALRRSADEAGYTVVELSVVMVLMSCLLVVAQQFMGATVRHTSDLDDRTRIQNEVRWAMTQVTRDLRQAHSGTVGTTAIEAMSATSITFLSPNRSTPYKLRRISYRLTGTTLERSELTSTNSNGPPWTFSGTAVYKPVATSVRALSFVYKGTGSAVVSTPTEVRRIEVSIDVDINPNRSPELQQYDTTVDLRSTR